MIAKIRYNLHLDDVDVGVAVVCAHPVVDEHSVVEESQLGNQFDPVEEVVAVPVFVQHGPPSQPLEQRHQRLRPSLLNRVCSERKR